MKRPAAAGKKPWSASPAGARSVPELVIRSTFIVGFPGETDADFQILLDWLDGRSSIASAVSLRAVAVRSPTTWPRRLQTK